MTSRFVLYALLVGCVALATMIYRHITADDPIRFEDLRKLIIAMPIGALLLWLRTDWARQFRRDASRRDREQP